MRKRLILMVAVVAAACGGAQPKGTPAKASLPGGGDDFAETHRLLDLFDRARVAPDPAARTELLAALGVKDEGPGAQTTDAAIDALLVRLDRVLAGDRLHAGAQAARTLLELDRKPAAGRAELFARMAAWKSIARGGGPLAGNALLRLWAFCERALHDATEAPPWDKPRVMSMCLYPLHDSDPEPYFAADPARRPPPPAWVDLVAKMNDLAAALAGQPKSRLAALAPALRARLDAFTRDAEARDVLPRPLDPRALAVPPVVDPPLATPYDGEPLVFVRDPSAAELAKFETDLRRLLDAAPAGRRGQAALVLRGDAAARGLLDVAALLRRLGAETVEIAVGWEQELRPPAGDYWYGRTGDGKVERLGVLPLRLDAARLGARAGLGLVLTVAPRAWRIVSPRGALPAIPVGADAAPARAELRAQLRRLLDAYPDESALAVAPDPSVTLAALAAAVHAAGRAADGTPLVAELALAAGPAPAAGTGDLAERVRRRAAAKVTLVPDALAGRQAAVRRCYLDALDRAPALAGTVAVELGGAGVVVVSGPEDATLRACVVDRLAGPMREGGIRNARVELGR